MILKTVILVLTGAIAGCLAHGQAGALDPSFNVGTGADSSIFDLALQPNGKIVVSGHFSSFNGSPQNYLVRLNQDGCVDSSFAPAPVTTGFPYAIARDRENRILVGGGSAALARLNPDGSIDEEFVREVVGVYWIGTDSYGRIIAAGNWSPPRPRIRRLIQNGAMDFSFDAGHAYPSDGWILSGVLRTNGDIVIAGNFNFINDQFRAGIAELEPNGNLSTNSFLDGVGNRVLKLALQPDGKVLAGGYFFGAVTRFTAAGDYDTSFVAPYIDADEDPAVVAAIGLQQDGRILIAGEFQLVGDTERNSIARLLPDGSLDTSFDSGLGPNAEIRAIQVQPAVEF